VRLVGLSVRGSSRFGVHGVGADHIALQDCEVAGSQDGGAVFIQSSNILVERCEVHGNNARGTSAAMEAISFDHVDGFEVTGSTVRDNGEEGIDAKYESNNGKIHGNIVRGNRGPNIYVDSAHQVEVYDNVVSGTTEGSKAGIALAVENYSETRRAYEVKIYNNVVTGNAGGGIGFWVESSGSFSDIQIVNNTVVGNHKGGLNIAAGQFKGTNILRNNIFSDNAADVSGDASAFTADHNLFSTGGIGANLVRGVVQFVDAAAQDLRLTESSPAIDAGSPDAAPALDITGAARPSGRGYDLGAYEFGARPPATVPTTVPPSGNPPTSTPPSGTVPPSTLPPSTRPAPPTVTAPTAGPAAAAPPPAALPTPSARPPAPPAPATPSPGVDSSNRPPSGGSAPR
jgi:hypothetical protein